MARMRRPDLKVIYMTAYDILGVEDEALGPILRKPIDEENFIAEVQRAIAIARPDLARNSLHAELPPQLAEGGVDAAPVRLMS